MTAQIDITMGPERGGAITYLALASPSPGGSDRYQLSFQAEFTNTPAAVSWSKDRIDVFARGTDNALYQKLWHA